MLKMIYRTLHVYNTMNANNKCQFRQSCMIRFKNDFDACKDPFSVDEDGGVVMSVMSPIYDDLR